MTCITANGISIGCEDVGMPGVKNIWIGIQIVMVYSFIKIVWNIFTK